MSGTKLCPKFEKTMEMISKRWTGLIIYQLLNGPQRFCAIETALPVSGRLLSERLKELEQHGVVKREVFPEIPVRIEYSLTPKGMALEQVIRKLEQWSKEWTNIDT